MSGSQGTLIQKWSKGFSVVVVGTIIGLHAAAFVLAALMCPEIFKARSYEGVHCQPSGEINSYELTGCDHERISEMRHTVGEGVCLTRGKGDIVKLQDIRMSFKFPLDETDELFSAWNWRLVASLAVNLNILEKDAYNRKASTNRSTKFSSLDEEIMLSASLDYAPMQLLEPGGKPKGSKNFASETDCIPSSPWHSKAIILHVNRTLSCRLMRKYSDKMVSDKESMASELSYHCSVHPLFELLVLSNSSYIMQVRLEAANSKSDIDILLSNATVSSHLTIVKETDIFHRLVFYTKCFFTPLILLSLVWFVVRLCVNDLYVTIHDRLLITAGLAQVVTNIPSEVVVANFPNPYLTLLDPLAYIILITSLALFWIIFTLDKLAVNEPWERNTRYYWRPISAIVIGSSTALLGVLYMRFPALTNPFNSHWLAGTTTYVSLGFIFGLAVIIASYQTYLSVLIFRVVCDISVNYPGSTRGAWRLKTILLYCLLCSILICLGSILRLAVSLCLHWNTEVHTDPLPFSVSLAGMIYLGEMAASNLHVSSLLVALSRSPGGPGGWYTPVRPVMYSPARRGEQLHLWDLSAHSSPLHK